MKNIILSTLVLFTGLQTWALNRQVIDSLPQQLVDQNYVRNPSCAINALGITGATAVTRSTSVKLDEGQTSCALDATTSGQTYVWATRTMHGLKGANCSASVTYRGDASLYEIYVIQNSIKVAPDFQLQNSGTSDATQIVTFPCGDLTNPTTVVLEATSNSAAAINVKVSAGKNQNIGTVSQAKIIGKAHFATTVNCNWTASNTGSFGPFNTDTDCPALTITENEGPGTISATNTFLPQITFNNLGAGKYRLITQMTMYSGASATDVNVTISDGITQDGWAGFRESSSANDITAINISSVFNYTSSGNRTFSVLMQSSSGSPILRNDVIGSKLNFILERIPKDSEQVLSLNVMPTNTDWVSFTPTGSWTSNAVYTGKWRREGPDALIEWNVQVTGTPSPDTSLLLNLPTEIPAIDTAKMAFSNLNNTWIAGAETQTYRSPGTYNTGIPGPVVYSSTTSVNPQYFQTNTSPALNFPSNITATNIWTKANGDFVRVKVRVPIVGWTVPTVSMPLVKMAVIARDNLNDVTTINTTRTVSANTTLLATDETLYVDSSAGDVTITVPDSSNFAGKKFIIVATSSSNRVVVSRSVSNTICGRTSIILTGVNDMVTLQPTVAGNWHDISGRCIVTHFFQMTLPNSSVVHSGFLSSVSSSGNQGILNFKSGVWGFNPSCSWSCNSNFVRNTAVASNNINNWAIGCADSSGTQISQYVGGMCVGPR